MVLQNSLKQENEEEGQTSRESTMIEFNFWEKILQSIEVSFEFQ
jgi:hypothetical protein